MKTVVNILLLHSIFLVFTNSIASPLIATKLPDFEYGESSAGNGGGNFATLNENLVVYVTQYYGQNKRVVVYNLKTQTSKTIHVEPKKADYTLVTTSDRLFSDGSVVYFVVDGNLYFSDGTAAGTKFVDSYGIYRHKDGIFPALYAGRVIDKILYFTFSPEISTSFCCGETGANYFLWRTDGTQEGTVKYSGSGGTKLLDGMFALESYNSDVVFFFKRNSEIGNESFELWRTTVGNSVELVESFYEEDQQFVSAYGRIKVVHNSEGSYFCTIQDAFPHETATGSRITKLWQVSNSGSVDLITRDCFLDSLHEFNDNVYFKSSTGLHYIDGTSEDINTVYSESLDDSQYESLCQINDKLYSSLNTDSDTILLEIEYSGGYRYLRKEPRKNKDNLVRISNCFAEKFIFYDVQRYGYSFTNHDFEHWLVDPNIGEMMPIKSSEPLGYTTRYSYFLNSRAKAGIQFCVPLFCIADGIMPGFPAILDLLLEEDI